MSIDNTTPVNTSTSQLNEFLTLFSDKPDKNIIPWIGGKAIGLSIIKNYPKNGPFYPAIKKSGQDDSVALIKVGYNPEIVDNNEVLLMIYIQKVSLYLLNDKWDYNFNDPDSPTKESLEVSKLSKQPVDLEELSRFKYNIVTKKIVDLRKSVEIQPIQVVDYIYNEHLRTAKNYVFKTKLKLRDKTIKYLEKFKKDLIKINSLLFGKTIKEDDNFDGFFDKYKHKNLISLSTEKISFLGADLTITKNSFYTFIIIILIVFILDYIFKINFFPFGMFKQYESNNIFLVSVVIVGFKVVDYFIPHFILIIINSLIKAKLRLLRLKIKL